MSEQSAGVIERLKGRLLRWLRNDSDSEYGTDIDTPGHGRELPNKYDGYPYAYVSASEVAIHTSPENHLSGAPSPRFQFGGFESDGSGIGPRRGEYFGHFTPTYEGKHLPLNIEIKITDGGRRPRGEIHIYEDVGVGFDVEYHERATGTGAKDTNQAD